VTVLALAVAGVAAWRFAPPPIAWRLAVLAHKANGRLKEIPLGSLLRWLKPGSPVYLEDLVETPNPHVAIRNTFIDTKDIEEGRTLYEQHCRQCHGETARGQTGPDLISAVAVKSDWSFLSAVKWGRPGTAMLAWPLHDEQIWQIHGFLRSKALAAAGQVVAASGEAPSRGEVDVDPQVILESDKRPEQWLTYAGNYLGHRHSELDQIQKTNVRKLQMAWVTQLRPIDDQLQSTPIVANGVMFVSESKDGVVALDARTGEHIWTYRRPIPDGLAVCCGSPNRGVAVLGKTVYVATFDAFLVALDANTGRERWITKVAEANEGYSMTGAPLAFRDRVVVGVSGGEFGVRGFIAAFDADSGHLLWKFKTIPEPGEVGHDTWEGDSWKTGGAPTWTVGAYDPELDLVFWGTGNPAPLFQADARRGDNLFSSSVVAVEAQSGRLRWYYQFTPHDDHDWDSCQQPILAEIQWQGQPRSVVLWANRNAFFYALDRRTGEFLFAKPFLKQTWNEGFDAKGRPKMAASASPSPSGSLVWPAISSATNWWPPSYDRSRQLVFVPSVEAASMFVRTERVKFKRMKPFGGGYVSAYAANQPTTAFVKAVDAQSGEIRWEAVLARGSDDFVWTVSGVLSTRGGVVFAGYRDLFRAFDADNGKELWRVRVGERVRGAPISYEVEGKQYIAVAAGYSLFAFTLPQP
jgi:alcohol dehydrogenase (cytochrome c)